MSAGHLPETIQQQAASSSKSTLTEGQLLKRWPAAVAKLHDGCHSQVGSTQIMWCGAYPDWAPQPSHLSGKAVCLPS